MMTIENEEDLRIAYTILRLYQKDKHLSRNYLLDLKRNIRDYLRYSNISTTHRIIKGDCDSYMVLITLPKFIESAEDANEWFMAKEYIKPYYTYYDCTGRPFTGWYKIFQRNGRWMAYHRVNYDV